MPSSFLTRIAPVIHWAAFISLLIFTPLAQGGASRWAFCVSLWLVLLAFTSMVLRRLWQGKRLLPHSPLEIPLALLLLLAAASWFMSVYRGATSWAFLRLCLYGVSFYMASEASASRIKTKRLLITLLSMGVLLSAIGFIKYTGGPTPFFWDYSAITEEGRLNSTFVNANHFAGYLEMILALGVGFVLYRATRKTVLWMFCLFFILVTLLFTMSRGAWIASLGFFMFIGVLLLLKKGTSKVKICVTASALLLILGLFVLGSNSMTERLISIKDPQKSHLDYGRLPVWKASVLLIRKYPLQGTGLGTFPWSFTTVSPAGLHLRYREAHNDYIQILTEMGLPVLIPVIWGLYLIFRTGLRTFWKTESRFQSGVTLGALGGIVAILIHSIWDFNIQITANGILFSVLVGLLMGSATSKTIEPQFRKIHQVDLRN